MSHSLSGLELLVVEDNAFIQLDLQMMLEDAGATVITASTVKEATELLGRSFHAAILDISLPDGEVRPVAEKLALVNTPIIFHSGIVEKTPWVDEIPRATAVSKPASEAVLIDLVHQYSIGDSEALR